jgi:hypothetical protein
MQRELAYRIPLKRLRRLRRTAARRNCSSFWPLAWLLAGSFALACLASGLFNRDIGAWMARHGLPDAPGLPLFICAALFMAGVVWLRAAQVECIGDRAEFDAIIYLTQDEGGLHFNSDAIEVYLKWHGIARLLGEPDGIAVSHGGSLWFIPDAAFHDAAERRAFIGDVYSHLDEAARSRSAKCVRAALAEQYGEHHAA